MVSARNSVLPGLSQAKTDLICFEVFWNVARLISNKDDRKPTFKIFLVASSFFVCLFHKVFNIFVSF